MSSSAILVGSDAVAQSSVTDQILEQIQNQGFEVLQVSRTLLGRVRVLARRGNQMRELVFDPRNGAILRDYSWTVDDPQNGQPAAPSGAGYDEDDDDDDDDFGGGDDDGDDGGGDDGDGGDDDD